MNTARPITTSTFTTAALPPFVSTFLTLERQAVELYKLAIVRVRRCDDILHLGMYRMEHEATAELLAYARREAGIPRDPWAAPSPLGHEWAVLGALTVDGDVFAHLARCEGNRHRIYVAALRDFALYGTAREILRDAIAASERREAQLRTLAA